MTTRLVRISCSASALEKYDREDRCDPAVREREGERGRAEGGQTERPIVRNGPRLFSSGRVREAAFSSPFTWGRVDDAACNLQVGFVRGQQGAARTLRLAPTAKVGREGIIDDVRTNL